MIRICTVLVALVGLSTASPVGAQSENLAEDDAYRRAVAILDESPVVDTHNDLPWVIREKLDGDVEGYDISVRARWDTDIPRLREGRVGVQFWSVYVPSSLGPFESMRAQLEQIDIARRIIELYPEDLAYALGVADIDRAVDGGRIASLLGIEGGHTIGNSLGALRAYYDLGVRYMTLTHFHSNDWADSATGEARHGGLTPFGIEVVREMNRLGMMVDLSHVSADAMADALDASEAPVIFSHSSARALTAHPRNVPDEILARMKDNGGVVMVAFIPPFVSEASREWSDGLFPLLAASSSDAEWKTLTEQYIAEHGEAPRATLADVADHIEYIARVAGIEHVGIGADFYGAEQDNMIVQGLEDVSKYPELFAELVRRGWSDEHLRMLAGGNLLRVFGEVESIAESLREVRRPSLAKHPESAADGRDD